jgi:hypothetical protein
MKKITHIKNLEILLDQLCFEIKIEILERADLIRIYANSGKVNEIKAVILQTSLCGTLGIGFAASSIIWIVQFMIGKHNVRRMNEKLFQTRDNQR